MAQDQCEAYALQNQFLNQEILELSQLLQQNRLQTAKYAHTNTGRSLHFFQVNFSLPNVMYSAIIIPVYWAFFSEKFSYHMREPCGCYVY